MTTWSNVFSGYDVYSDVFNTYTSLYANASASAGFFQFFDGFIVKLPYDVMMFFQIFYNVLPLTILAIMFFVLFMPLIKRPQQW